MGGNSLDGCEFVIQAMETRRKLNALFQVLKEKNCEPACVRSNSLCSHQKPDTIQMSHTGGITHNNPYNPYYGRLLAN